MARGTLNILIADDDKGDCAQIRHVLRQDLKAPIGVRLAAH
jgi:hypothetical protein